MHDAAETDHHVRLVPDDALPEGQDFAFVDCHDDDLWLLLKKSRVTPKVLEEAWTTYRTMVS